MAYVLPRDGKVGANVISTGNSEIDKEDGRWHPYEVSDPYRGPAGCREIGALPADDLGVLKRQT